MPAEINGCPGGIRGGGPLAVTDDGVRAIAETFGLSDVWPLLRDRMIRAGAWTLRESVEG